MALKICLKPKERMIIGGAVVMNSGPRCDLIVENNVPVLRERDIVSEADANTPCRRIYFVIQLMYVDEKNLAAHHELYWSLVRDVVNAAPSTLSLIHQISEQILIGKYYQALKITRQLIEYEQEVLKNVREPIGSI